jgi:hypothetical protein
MLSVVFNAGVEQNNVDSDTKTSWLCVYMCVVIQSGGWTYNQGHVSLSFEHFSLNSKLIKIQYIAQKHRENKTIRDTMCSSNRGLFASLYGYALKSYLKIYIKTFKAQKKLDTI